MTRYLLGSVPAAIVILAMSACSTHAVPPSGGDAALRDSTASSRAGRSSDTRSILKKLTQQVTVGSTVDHDNGDRGPRAISIVPRDWHGVLQKDEILVCNFEDSSGTAGNGTTIEALNPKPSSTPSRFYQSTLISGCDGVAMSSPNFDAVYGAGYASGKIVAITKKGGTPKTYSGNILRGTLADAGADPSQAFSPLFVLAGATAAGGIVSISTGFYGDGRAVQVAKGFTVANGSQGELGPSGLQYDRTVDTLYIVDGANNTVVAFSNASKLLAKDEIIVEPGGQAFQCKYPSTTCGRVVYSGAPLDAPMESALLPNGNLIVANSQGTPNTLIELTPQGQVLDTKVVGSGSTQSIFGLAARGTTDSNTVLFFTDTGTDTVQELER